MNFLRNLFSRMYGLDKMGKITLTISILLTLLGNIFRIRFIYLLGEVIFLYSAFRFISSNRWARQRENEKFLVFFNNLKLKAKQTRVRLSDSENNYFRCPKCGTVLSVPKGVGKIMIVCRKCSHQFIKKSR